MAEILHEEIKEELKIEDEELVLYEKECVNDQEIKQ